MFKAIPHPEKLVKKHYPARFQYTVCIQSNHCVFLYVCVKLWRVMAKVGTLAIENISRRALSNYSSSDDIEDMR